MDLKALYRDAILDHYKKPRNATALWGEEHAPGDSERSALCKNPSCGDRVTVQLQLEDGTVRSIAMLGTGCAISQASASMMTEAIKGQPLTKVHAIHQEFRQMIVHGKAAPDSTLLGDLLIMQGVAQLHARVKCALCGWSALETALAQGGEVDLESDTSLPDSSL